MGRRTGESPLVRSCKVAGITPSTPHASYYSALHDIVCSPEEYMMHLWDVVKSVECGVPAMMCSAMTDHDRVPSLRTRSRIASSSSLVHTRLCT